LTDGSHARVGRLARSPARALAGWLAG